MALSKSESGRLGGLSTVKKHGQDWMREIGKRGFQSFTNRYFAGDKLQAGEWLRLRAAEKQIGTLAVKELDRRIAEGAEAACVELPVLLEPGDDPFYYEGSWLERIGGERVGRRR
jgi:hypothetical protein